MYVARDCCTSVRQSLFIILQISKNSIFILYNNHTYQIEKYRAADGRAPSKNYLAKLKNVDEGAYKVLKTIRNLKPRKIDNIFYVNYLASLKKI